MTRTRARPRRPAAGNRRGDRWTSGVLVAALLAYASGVACAPEGSERWCRKLQEKSKLEWTADEVSGFAKHCMFKE